ncbi:MAG: hypothetical protein BIFFINMI_01903 [Phycisphaerae bacterium]|nr:hypothetical protein [Phycisphaerae bacterium]
MKSNRVWGLTAVIALGLLSLAGCQKDAPTEASDRPVTPTATAPTTNITYQSEIDLVEKTASARLSYETYLKALRDYYESQGMHDKRVWADRELEDLAKVRKYRYLVAADTPGAADVHPRDLIAEANELFMDAKKIYDNNRAVPLVFNKDELRVALNKFDRIIRQYPTSDKVDDAAYYEAEIYKEYFDENLKAIEYYKLAYQADPDTPHPAHFQRAVILDFRLYRRDEALVEYRAVVESDSSHDTWQSKSDRDFAAARIKQLTTGVDHDER